MRITAARLRGIIREEIMREADRGMDSMHAAALRGNRERITEAMMKTHKWFNDVVIPSVEMGVWPIRAQEDYLLAPSYLNLRDPNAFFANAATDTGVYIKSGTTWMSPSQGAPLSVGDSSSQLLKKGAFTLAEAYELFENAILENDLPIPMQSY